MKNIQKSEPNIGLSNLRDIISPFIADRLDSFFKDFSEGKLTELNPLSDDHFWKFMEGCLSNFFDVELSSLNNNNSSKITNIIAENPDNNNIAYLSKSIINETSAEISFERQIVNFDALLQASQDNKVKLIIVKKIIQTGTEYGLYSLHIKINLYQNDKTEKENFFNINFLEFLAKKISKFPEFVEYLWLKHITLHPNIMLATFVKNARLVAGIEYWTHMLATTEYENKANKKLGFFFEGGNPIQAQPMYESIGSYLVDCYEKDEDEFKTTQCILSLNNFFSSVAGIHCGLAHIRVLSCIMKALIEDFGYYIKENLDVVKALISCGAFLLLSSGSQKDTSFYKLYLLLEDDDEEGLTLEELKDIYTHQIKVYKEINQLAFIQLLGKFQYSVWEKSLDDLQKFIISPQQSFNIEEVLPFIDTIQAIETTNHLSTEKNSKQTTQHIHYPSLLSNRHSQSSKNEVARIKIKEDSCLDTNIASSSSSKKQRLGKL